MKKYTHAWLAFMAIKRLEYADIPKENQEDAKSLVKWFHNYRDFAIIGSWYPDEVFKDMATSHIIKYSPAEGDRKTNFKDLPKTMEMYNWGKKSKLYGKPFIIGDGNCADRCESIAHSIVDNFKILEMEDKGTPIATSANHIAMRFFILSHYIADCHMPLHCDARPFSGGADLHGYIEGIWDNEVRKSYKIDIDNNRFFYAPDGYPLADKISDLMQSVEDDLVKRPFLYPFGMKTVMENGKERRKSMSTWDYISAVSEYSYLMAYDMLPMDMDPKTTQKEYKNSEAYKNLPELSRMIFCDAIDSIARIWLHVWARYRKWDAERVKS